MEERLFIINNKSNILVVVNLLKDLKINYKYSNLGGFYVPRNDVQCVVDAFVSEGIRFT